MGMDFPNSPTVGQVFTNLDRSWMWDGVAWVGVSGAPLGLFGTEANKPVTPGSAVMRYWATDTKRDWLWDGTGWIIMREPTQPLTATARQNSVAVANTVSGTGFKRSDGWCDIYVQLNITGAGTNATPFDVLISGHPAILVGGVPSGVFTYYDAGNAIWSGSAGVVASGVVGFTSTGTNYTLGANPAFAAANGDTIGFTLRYRMNSPYS